MTTQTMKMHAENIDAGLPAFVWRIFGVFALLAALSVAIYAFGSIYGDRLAKVGQSTDTTLLQIIIGNDAYAIPANMIRRSEQRSGGAYERIDTYVHWPTKSGYSEDLAAKFGDTNPKTIEVVFATFSERKSLLDMAERFVPVYKNAIETDKIKPLSNGLYIAPLAAEYGYMNERLLYSRIQTNGKPAFVARCQVSSGGQDRLLLPCETDIFVGETSEMRVRFPASELGRWKAFLDELVAFSTSVIQNK